MEEKDVTFNFVIREPDDDGSSNIDITSDIDECVDYLDIEENVCLVAKIISLCCKQIFDENYPDNFDEEDEESQDRLIHELNQLQEVMVYTIINTIHSAYMAILDKDPEFLEFSIATYKKSMNNYLSPSQMVVDTQHSADVDVLTPFQAGFEFFKDTILCLLDGGLPKSEVWSLVTGSFEAMKKDYKNIIDLFEKE